MTRCRPRIGTKRLGEDSAGTMVLRPQIVANMAPATRAATRVRKNRVAKSTPSNMKAYQTRSSGFCVATATQAMAGATQATIAANR